MTSRRFAPLLALLLLVGLGAYGGAASASSDPGRITVHGQHVAISCTGHSAPGTPTVVLLAGMPDPLTIFGSLQTQLSERYRVCAYDRLGEGASESPARAQTLRDSAQILHGVVRQLGIHGRDDVVLVGHSLGGLVAAEYAHRFRNDVHALVLLDATPPSVVQGVLNLIPADETGIAAEVRGGMSALVSGNNPERLVYDGQPVGSLDVPVTVVEHGLPIFSAVPDYGADLQRLWSAGQRQWLASASDGQLVTAQESGHYIYLDQPQLTVDLITQAAR